MLRWRQIPWRDRPTDRQRAITERYAQVIRKETGKIVDPETIRAVRYTILRHSGHAIFDSLRELEVMTARAKLNRKREYASKLLAEAEEELQYILNDDELKELTTPELRARAESLGVKGHCDMRKFQLIQAIRSVYYEGAFGDDDA